MPQETPSSPSYEELVKKYLKQYREDAAGAKDTSQYLDNPDKGGVTGRVRATEDYLSDPREREFDPDNETKYQFRDKLQLDPSFDKPPAKQVPKEMSSMDEYNKMDKTSESSYENMLPWEQDDLRAWEHRQGTHSIFDKSLLGLWRGYARGGEVEQDVSDAGFLGQRSYGDRYYPETDSGIQHYKMKGGATIDKETDRALGSNINNGLANVLHSVANFITPRRPSVSAPIDSSPKSNPINNYGLWHGGKISGTPPSNPMQDNKLVPMRSGEYVIPEPVVKHFGKKHFDGMVKSVTGMPPVGSPETGFWGGGAGDGPPVEAEKGWSEPDYLEGNWGDPNTPQGDQTLGYYGGTDQNPTNWYNPQSGESGPWNWNQIFSGYMNDPHNKFAGDPNYSGFNPSSGSGRDPNAMVYIPRDRNDSSGAGFAGPNDMNNELGGRNFGGRNYGGNDRGGNNYQGGNFGGGWFGSSAGGTGMPGGGWRGGGMPWQGPPEGFNRGMRRGMQPRIVRGMMGLGKRRMQLMGQNRFQPQADRGRTPATPSPFGPAKALTGGD